MPRVQVDAIRSWNVKGGNLVMGEPELLWRIEVFEPCQGNLVEIDSMSL